VTSEISSFAAVGWVDNKKLCIAFLCPLTKSTNALKTATVDQIAQVANLDQSIGEEEA
jgi:hypothetical protein